MLENNKDNKKKHGLGRGLGSLFGEELSAPTEETQQKVTTTSAPVKTTAAPTVEAATGSAVTPNTTKVETGTVDLSARVWTVSIDKLIPNKDQPRKDFAQDKISELAASIREQGILQPITVRSLDQGRYEIIAGERRWRAAQAAGLHEVPVIVKEADNKKVLEWALIENIQRENLNPIEEAEAYSQLLDEHNYTHQELATKLGKERATISNALRLLTLTKDVRDMVREQKISVGHAKVLLALEDSGQQKQLAQQIIKKSLSVRATEREVAALKSNNSTVAAFAEPTTADRLAQAMSSELQKSLGTRVNIDYVEGKGKVTIHFYSDAELTKIADRLRGHV